MKTSKGFTISEILIAMLVLGIIVAATVPVILELKPNKNAILMRKAYYTTETIIHGLLNDPNYYPDMTVNCINPATGEEWDNNQREEHHCYYGLDYTLGENEETPIIGTGVRANNTNRLRCIFASKLNIREDLDTFCAGSYNAETPAIVHTMDGIRWDLTGLTQGSNEKIIRVDVDGEQKGPNKFALSGWVTNNACNSIYTWGNSSCSTSGVGKDGASYTEISVSNHWKTFDLAAFQISVDGKLSIPTGQNMLSAIIAGEVSMFKDNTTGLVGDVRIYNPNNDDGGGTSTGTGNDHTTVPGTGNEPSVGIEK